ncbi:MULTISPECIES: RimK family alpha-L-glutamate ligase [Streptomyces]|uniref:RimK family alpha-L-glutamate ligase n=1 Tax=Streptomyces TaxID=1883 RepID=UPI0004C18B5D|nr:MULTISPECIES: RimK family alpha-L-glutamate ligase [Streptomyces]
MASPEQVFTLLASRVRTEEKLIMAAFERHGASFDHIDARNFFIVSGGLGPAPRVVLNREIGQFRAGYAAGALENAGATVVNSAAATAVCGDKWLTTEALRNRGLPTPRAALALTPEAGLAALEEIGYPAVIKPLVGSWGRLVTPVADRQTAAAVLEHVAALSSPQSHIVYVQQLVPKLDRDIRVIVVGGEALGATYRRSPEWRTNVARGGVSEYCELGQENAKLAVAAAEAVGADIAGVDLVEDGDGRVSVLEVNHRVEFAGFQAAQGDRVDVADRIVRHLMTRAAS